MPASEPVPKSDLTAELVERCYRLLAGKSWDERLQALMQMHDQLRDDIQDFQLFCDIFPRFVEQLVDRFGVTEVKSFEQAQVMANSASRAHRDAAGAWIEGHYGRSSQS